jgi:hypothetical protein
LGSLHSEQVEIPGAVKASWDLLLRVRERECLLLGTAMIYPPIKYIAAFATKIVYFSYNSFNIAKGEF